MSDTLKISRLVSLAAVTAVIGDCLMFQAREGPPMLVIFGGILGAIAIPLYAFGYAAFARTVAIRPRFLHVSFHYFGVLFAVLGGTLHGLTALLLAYSPFTDPLAPIVSAGPWIIVLWSLTAAFFSALSVAYVAAAFKRQGWSAVAFNPLALSVMISLPGLIEEKFLLLLLLAPNLAHVVFFSLTVPRFLSSKACKGKETITPVEPKEGRPMRVLMINSNRFKQPWPVMPFGLCCVASAVEAAGHGVRFLDLCFSKKPSLDIERAITQFKPDVVGVSIRNLDNCAGCDTLFLLDDVRDAVIKPLRQAFAGPVVVGGPAVGVNPVEILRYLGLAYAVRGDGEAVFIELLRRLERNDALGGLPGLIEVRNGAIVQENAPWRVADLDSLTPARPQRWLDLAAYRKFNAPLPIQTKRGCALRCTYCTYNGIEGRHWRLRNPQKVADEIEALYRETGIDEFEFTDSTFNFPLSHCKSVLRAIIAKGLPLHLCTMGLNPGAVDEELVELMRRGGFQEVDLGAESLCDDVLRGLGKNFRKEDVFRAARLLHQAGIPLKWDLLFGGPKESPETLRETFAALRSAAAPWDLVDVGVGLRIYNRSPLARRLQVNDPHCTADNFFQLVAWAPEAAELNELKRLIKRESLQNDNWFLYHEDENTPPWLLKIGALLIRFFAPRQPMWRLFILRRKLERLLGINALRQLRPSRLPRAASMPTVVTKQQSSSRVPAEPVASAKNSVTPIR
jgi:hypothetical protein